MALAKKSFPIFLSALAAFFVINTAIASILPMSSYVYDSTENAGVSVNYAIYKTKELELESEQEFFASMPASLLATDYVYVYQLYNEDYDDIDAFSLSGLGDDAIENDDHISSEEDLLLDPGDRSPPGIVPSDMGYGDGYAQWMFDEQLIYGGGHSYWLIIQSDNDWVMGNYDLEAIDNGFSAPDQGLDVLPTPEPITITLLGIGGLILRKRTTR